MEVDYGVYNWKVNLLDQKKPSQKGRAFEFSGQDGMI